MHRRVLYCIHCNTREPSYYRLFKYLLRLYAILSIYPAIKLSMQTGNEWENGKPVAI